ncbi:hypothetical protein GCG54_00003485, partial [Colletotrichum gloeosporioides]
ILSNVDSSSTGCHPLWTCTKTWDPPRLINLETVTQDLPYLPTECIFLSLGQGDGAAESEPGCLQIDDFFSDGIVGREASDRTLISKTTLSSASVLPQSMPYQQSGWIHLNVSF